MVSLEVPLHCPEPDTRGHGCQRGEAPPLRTHSGAKTEEREGPRVLLFLPWCSPLPLGGLCRVAEAALSCSGSTADPGGAPEAFPCLPSSRTWPPSWLFLQSVTELSCVAESPPLGTQAHQHPAMLLMTHPFLLIPGRLWLWCPQALGCQPRPQQRPLRYALFIPVCPLHLGESD